MDQDAPKTRLITLTGKDRPGVTAAVSINVRLTFEDADRAVADAAAPAARVR